MKFINQILKEADFFNPKNIPDRITERNIKQTLLLKAYRESGNRIIKFLEEENISYDLKGFLKILALLKTSKFKSRFQELDSNINNKRETKKYILNTLMDIFLPKDQKLLVDLGSTSFYGYRISYNDMLPFFSKMTRDILQKLTKEVGFTWEDCYVDFRIQTDRFHDYVRSAQQYFITGSYNNQSIAYYKYEGYTSGSGQTYIVTEKGKEKASTFLSNPAYALNAIGLKSNSKEDNNEIYELAKNLINSSGKPRKTKEIQNYLQTKFINDNTIQVGPIQFIFKNIKVEKAPSEVYYIFFTIYDTNTGISEKSEGWVKTKDDLKKISIKELLIKGILSTYSYELYNFLKKVGKKSKK